MPVMKGTDMQGGRFSDRIIETDRLVMRPFTPGDHAAFCVHRQDPEVYPFIGGYLNDEECWHRLMRYSGHWAEFGYGIFAITLRDDGSLIGEAGLADYHRGLGEGFDGYPEAGWALSSSVWRRGYGGEMLAGIHDWYRAHFGPARTVCMITPDNVASLNLAMIAGYRSFDERLYHDRPAILLERPAA